MTTTPNIALSKPAAGASNWDVDVNANADILDALFDGTTGNHDHSGVDGHGPNLPQSSVTGLVTALANKQAADADLTTIAGLTATTDNFMQAKTSAWASRTPAQVTADLPAVVGDSGSGGTKGLVPAPGAGDAAAGKFLKADGTFAIPAGSGMSNPMTTQDDLIVGGVAGAPARLAKGTDGQVLTVDPTTHHLVWATPSGGGGASISRGADASRPAAGTAGALYLPTDGFAAYEDNGTAWQPFGPVFPLAKPPAIASLSWLNQGSAVASENNGGLTLSMAASGGENVRALLASTPATPYTFTVGLLPCFTGATFQLAGIIWRESGTGKLTTWELIWANPLVLRRGDWNGATSFSAQSSNTNIAPAPLFLRVSDDGTNRKLLISSDGQTFNQLASFARTTFITPDQIGVFIDNNSSQPMSCTFFHWSLV